MSDARHHATIVNQFTRQAVPFSTGIDLTPAMIAEARRLQGERGRANVSWRVGDVLPLPFDAGAFSIVASRYAFHHLLDPAGVLGEMARVCAPGSRVMLIDVEASPDPARAAEFNRMEKLRDPSRSFPDPGDAAHVRAIVHAAIDDDRLGIPVWRDGPLIRLAYPIAVLVAAKTSAAA